MTVIFLPFYLELKLYILFDNENIDWEKDL